MPSSGCNCSESDAVIRRDEACDWDWRQHPAPGADDNGTGIACLWSRARFFPTFRSSSTSCSSRSKAEELGLLGSAAFADSIVGGDQEILAVFNMDRSATTRAQPDGLVPNETSAWFADYVEPPRWASCPTSRSTSRWCSSPVATTRVSGRSASTRYLVNEDIDVLYPQYHTFQDTWETTFPANGRPNRNSSSSSAANFSSPRLLGSPSTTRPRIFRCRPASWSMLGGLGDPRTGSLRCVSSPACTISARLPSVSGRRHHRLARARCHVLRRKSDPRRRNSVKSIDAGTIRRAE